VIRCSITLFVNSHPASMTHPPVLRCFQLFYSRLPANSLACFVRWLVSMWRWSLGLGVITCPSGRAP